MAAQIIAPSPKSVIASLPPKWEILPCLESTARIGLKKVLTLIGAQLCLSFHGIC